MTKQEFIDYLANNLTYEEIEMADAEAKAYAKGFKEGLEARKQGEWIHDRLEADGAKLPDLFLPLCQCSECTIYVQYESNFCPNCGARMKGAYDETD